ncbi:MAG: glycosyltransferase family 4 protein [Acidiferrobacteraceae bacterium]
MNIGVDFRPVTAAPQSGIARQIRAVMEGISATPGCVAVPFTVLPSRAGASPDTVRPEWNTDHLHRPLQRLRFEQGFLPGALRREGLAAYIATANSGLPWLGRPAGIRYIVLLHDLFQLTMPKPGLRDLRYRLFDTLNLRLSLQRADRIWTPSRYTAEQVARTLPDAATRVRILANRVERMAPDLSGIPKLPPRYWLAVGVHEPRKNIPFFLKTWAHASQSNPSIPELVLIGEARDVPRDHLRDGRLHIHSGLSDGVLAAIYRNAEVLWHPSYGEGFGLPPLEALAQGTPVIVAHGSALDETVPPDALRFPPQGTLELARLMQVVAAQPLPRDLPSFSRWVDGFNADAHRRRMQALLLEALDPQS